MTHRSKISTTAVFLLAAAASVASPAFAQSEREQLQLARDAMERGQEFYLGERYAEAAEAFLEAYEARPFSAFLYNAGIAYERLGQAQNGITYYERYLDAEPDASDAEAVRERITRLRAAIEQATAPDPNGTDPNGTDPNGTDPNGTDPNGTDPNGTDPNGTDPNGTDPNGTDPNGTDPNGTDPNGTDPNGTDPNETPTVVPAGPAPVAKSLLSVETNPSDARITLRVGGSVIAQGQSPFAETLDEGDYEISVEHPDYRTVTRTMRVRPGKVYVAILELSQGEFLGFLRVVSDPPGANVFLDNREEGAVGQTPYSNPVPTGEHRIWVERPGYGVEERTVEIGLGEQITERLELERVTYGRLRVIANTPGAKVLIDGREVGEVPYEGQVDAGLRRVTVTHDGMKDWEEDVDVQRGQLTPIRVRLRPAVSRGGAWAMLSTSLLAAGAGVALGFLSDGLRSDLRDDRNAGLLSDDDDRFSRGKIMSISANAAFGLAGLLGLLSIYYFVRDPLPDSEATVLEPRDWALMPRLNPVDRSGGADLVWSF
ncbi:MAG: PEGA domain-containing protein [Myxococcota bacterium]